MFVGSDVCEDPTSQQFGVVAVDNQQSVAIHNKTKMATTCIDITTRAVSLFGCMRIGGVSLFSWKSFGVECNLDPYPYSVRCWYCTYFFACIE